MELSELQRKLIVAGRSTPPSDAVPYAFEKRVMARLKDARPVDPFGLWAQAFTRSAICCVLLMTAIVAGTWYLSTRNSQPLPQEIEQSLYAATDNGMMDQDMQ
jgi:hypothetical protein